MARLLHRDAYTQKACSHHWKKLPRRAADEFDTPFPLESFLSREKPHENATCKRITALPQLASSRSSGLYENPTRTCHL